MSFKIKDKTIYMSLVSIVTLILTVTFCILTFNNEREYAESFKTVIALVIGYFFRDTQKINKEGE